MATNGSTVQPDVCPPVWQYILIMCADIAGSLDAVSTIGDYHYGPGAAPGDEAKLEAIAKLMGPFADELRGLVEGLTSWKD